MTVQYCQPCSTASHPIELEFRIRILLVQSDLLIKDMLLALIRDVLRTKADSER